MPRSIFQSPEVKLVAQALVAALIKFSCACECHQWKNALQISVRDVDTANTRHILNVFNAGSYHWKADIMCKMRGAKGHELRILAFYEDFDDIESFNRELQYKTCIAKSIQDGIHS